VKIFDTLLGRSKQKQANLDALFAVSGAAITLQAGAGLQPSGEAAVCFKPASGEGFAATSAELTELLDLAVKEAGSTLRVEEDRYGYRWVIIGDPDLEDLVTSVHLINTTLKEHGYGPQLLCTVFGFTSAPGTPGARQQCFLVYLFKRGTFYPFAPRDDEKRDNELELRVRATLGSDLPVEPDLTRWFALWGVPIR